MLLATAIYYLFQLNDYAFNEAKIKMKDSSVRTIWVLNLWAQTEQQVLIHISYLFRSLDTYYMKSPKDLVIHSLFIVVAIPLHTRLFISFLHESREA